jgi:cytochrome P450
MPIDPLSPEFRADPYPFYDSLRSWEPVARLSSGAWLATRYADVKELLHSPLVSHWSDPRANGSSFDGILGRWVRFMDPRNGAHLAKLVKNLFSPPSCERLRAALAQEVERLLAAAEARGHTDAVAALAEPVALAAIATILGVPPEDRHRFEQAARGVLGRFFQMFDPRAGISPEAAAFAAYLGELFARKRIHPGDDLVSAILEAARLGDAIVEADHLPFTAIFLYAGHENMANFLALSILSLARFPDQWAALCDRPALAANAVEELLRYESPVQIVSLAAKTDFHLGACRIAEGETVLAAIGAANRDPQQFAMPARLNILRSPIPHLSFGAGALRCVGAALARLEAQVTLTALVDRLACPSVPECSWQWGSSPAYLRGLASLRIPARAAKVAP